MILYIGSVKQTLKSQYLTALDVCVMALHWAAVPWETLAPGVAVHIRRIANNLSERAATIRRGSDSDEAETEITEVPTPTEVVTKRYGEPPPE